MRNGSRLDLKAPWQLFALLGLIASVVYMFSPVEGKAVALISINLGAGLAVLLGVRLNRPSYALPWQLIGVGIVVFGVGNAIWALVNVTWGERAEVVPLAHLLFFTSYVLIGSGMLAMLRSRVRHSLGPVLLDGLIIFSGLAIFGWILLIQPLAVLEGATASEQILGAAYPTGDLFMLGAVGALLLTRSGGSFTGRLLTAAMAMNFVADLGYLWITLEGNYELGMATDLGWFGAYTLLAVAALHPAMTSMTEPVEDLAPMGMRRLLAFVAASAILPIGVLTEHVTGLHVDPATALFGSSIIMLLVITRMVLLIRQGHLNMAKLQAAETRFRNLVEQIPAVAYVDAGDATSTNLYMSPRIEELTGYPAEEWMGRVLWFEIMHPDDVAAVKAAHLLSKESGVFECDYRLIAKDGRTIWIRDEARRVSLEDGDVIWQGILKDLTGEKATEVARVDLEERLRQVHKMEAVGELAGGIAHDFNNLLAVIQSYTRFVQDEVTDERLRHDLDEVITASERGAALVKQLLAFARKEIIEPEVLDLNQITIDLMPLLERTAPDNVEFKLNLAPEPMSVVMGRGQFDQILMNLVMNAVEAIPNVEGQVVVETYPRAVDGTEGLELAPGPYVCLKVTDSGRGMTPEVMDRIFEPFFTTKERASGTGLGLASVYGIASRLGGAVQVDSAERTGSSFTVYLPAIGATGAEAEADPKAGTDRDERPGRLLVVEDEGAIARLLHRVLTQAGHAVDVFTDPLEALEHVRTSGAKPDVLLADVLMPNISGRDLAERVSEIHPSVRVIYMSGYTADVVAQQGVVGRDERFLQKPFSTDALLDEIARALGATEVRA